MAEGLVLELEFRVTHLQAMVLLQENRGEAVHMGAHYFALQL